MFGFSFGYTNRWEIIQNELRTETVIFTFYTTESNTISPWMEDCSATFTKHESFRLLVEL